MKYFKIVVFMVLANVVFDSCTTKTEEKNEAVTDSAARTAPVQPDLNSNQSALLLTILGSQGDGDDNAVLRGISFGDPVAKVKENESFEMFEETPDHLGYTSETPQLETIDVQYFFGAEKTIRKMTVDVYLNSPAATKQLWTAAKSYFSEKGTVAKDEPRKIMWTTKSARIIMEDVSEGKDFGLKFQFTTPKKNVLAAN